MSIFSMLPIQTNTANTLFAADSESQDTALTGALDFASILSEFTAPYMPENAGVAADESALIDPQASTPSPVSTDTDPDSPPAAPVEGGKDTPDAMLDSAPPNLSQPVTPQHAEGFSPEDVDVTSAGSIPKTGADVVEAVDVPETGAPPTMEELLLAALPVQSTVVTPAPAPASAASEVRQQTPDAGTPPLSGTSAPAPNPVPATSSVETGAKGVVAATGDAMPASATALNVADAKSATEPAPEAGAPREAALMRVASAVPPPAEPPAEGAVHREAPITPPAPPEETAMQTVVSARVSTQDRQTVADQAALPAQTTDGDLPVDPKATELVRNRVQVEPKQAVVAQVGAPEAPANPVEAVLFRIFGLSRTATTPEASTATRQADAPVTMQVQATPATAVPAPTGPAAATVTPVPTADTATVPAATPTVTESAAPAPMETGAPKPQDPLDTPVPAAPKVTVDPEVKSAAQPVADQGTQSGTPAGSLRPAAATPAATANPAETPPLSDADRVAASLQEATENRHGERTGTSVQPLGRNLQAPALIAGIASAKAEEVPQTTAGDVIPGVRLETPSVPGASSMTQVNSNAALNMEPVAMPADTPAGTVVRTTLPKLEETIVREVRLTEVPGGKQITIQLVPDSLGEIRLEIQGTQDEMRVRLITAHPHVRDSLDGQLQHLRDALAKQGLDVQRVEVSLDTSAGQHQGGRAAQQERNPDGSPRTLNYPASTYAGNESAKDSRPAPRNVWTPAGGLNVFA
ncbi:MAG: flagellar hook-length control protein FliK [Candidatus Hydrogenedentes bacterium]|nr:flagellar hook-length control protein FliK [Candidatus Hydrogenedentota bacterium]